jgi:hypothetical protein
VRDENPSVDVAAVWSGLSPLVDSIARIAREHEPDWTVVDPEADLHNWCGETCPRVSDLLADACIPSKVVRGKLRDWTHTWLVLADGSILDPTISQFDRPGSEYTVDTDTEVRWLCSSTGARIALIAASETLHRDYRPRSSVSELRKPS